MVTDTELSDSNRSAVHSTFSQGLPRFGCTHKLFRFSISLVAKEAWKGREGVLAHP